jgi:hypothetical protein
MAQGGMGNLYFVARRSLLRSAKKILDVLGYDRMVTVM